VQKALLEMCHTHEVEPVPAYDLDGRLIHPTNYYIFPIAKVLISFNISSLILIETVSVSKNKNVKTVHKTVYKENTPKEHGTT
jgi:hypothetical protein